MTALSGHSVTLVAHGVYGITPYTFSWRISTDGFNWTSIGTGATAKTVKGHFHFTMYRTDAASYAEYGFADTLRFTDGYFDLKIGQ